MPKPNIKFECLKALLATKNDTNELVVTMENFGKVCAWFGPLEVPYKDQGFLTRISYMCKQKWFHGDIASAEANNRLRSHKAGVFLVRLSTNPSHPNAFVISKVSKNNKVVHVRVQHPSPNAFVLPDGRKFKSCEDIIELDKDLYLQKPCPGSKYRYIFDTSGAELGGYV